MVLRDHVVCCCETEVPNRVSMASKKGTVSMLAKPGALPIIIYSN